MKCHNAILACLKANGFTVSTRLYTLSAHLKRIDHDIPDADDPLGRDTFAHEILVTVGRWGKQQISKRIRHDAVDLLGHVPVPASQARFQMSNGYSQLRGCKGTGERRVY